MTEQASAPIPEHIAASLAPFIVGVETLHEDPQNARRHPDRNLGIIGESLKNYGQVRPILVRHDGTIIAGNGTYRAAKMLGWTRIAAIPFEDDDPARARAFGICDNESALTSEWDFTALANTLQEIDTGAFDVSAMTGFDSAELARIAEWVPSKSLEESTADCENSDRGFVCPKCGYVFGESSTSPEPVQKKP